MKYIKVLVPVNSTWKRFGNPDLGFRYFYSDGYLFVVCWGGTAFAKKANIEDVDMLMKSVSKSLTEEGIITYCEKNNWLHYNYYDDTVHEKDPMPILLDIKIR